MPLASMVLLPSATTMSSLVPATSAGVSTTGGELGCTTRRVVFAAPEPPSLSVTWTVIVSLAVVGPGTWKLKWLPPVVAGIYTLPLSSTVYVNTSSLPGSTTDALRLTWLPSAEVPVAFSMVGTGWTWPT